MSPFLDTAAICHRFIDISTAAHVTFTAICRHFVVSISLRHLPPSRCLISVSLPHTSWRLLRTPSPPVLFHVSLSFPTLTIRKYSTILRSIAAFPLRLSSSLQSANHFSHSSFRLSISCFSTLFLPPKPPPEPSTSLAIRLRRHFHSLSFKIKFSTQ